MTPEDETGYVKVTTGHNWPAEVHQSEQKNWASFSQRHVTTLAQTLPTCTVSHYLNVKDVGERGTHLTRKATTSGSVELALS